eukprot:g28877.t1
MIPVLVKTREGTYRLRPQSKRRKVVLLQKGRGGNKRQKINMESSSSSSSSSLFLSTVSCSSSCSQSLPSPRVQIDLLPFLPEPLQACVLDFLPVWEIGAEPHARFWYRANCALVNRTWLHIFRSGRAVSWAELAARLSTDRSFTGFQRGMLILKQLLPGIDQQLARWNSLPDNFGHFFLQHANKKEWPVPDTLDLKAITSPFSTWGPGVQSLTPLRTVWLFDLMAAYQHRLPVSLRVTSKQLDRFSKSLMMDEEASMWALLSELSDQVWPPWKTGMDKGDHEQMNGEGWKQTHAEEFDELDEDSEQETEYDEFPTAFDWSDLNYYTSQALSESPPSSSLVVQNKLFARIWQESTCPLHGVLDSTQLSLRDCTPSSSPQAAVPVACPSAWTLQAERHFQASHAYDSLLDHMHDGASLCWFIYRLLDLDIFQATVIMDAFQTAFGPHHARDLAGFFLVMQPLFHLFSASESKALYLESIFSDVLWGTAQRSSELEAQ